MKIKAIETHIIPVTKRGDWVFVKVHTDEGVTGIGEASHGRGDGRVVQIVNELKPALIGRAPFQIEDFHRRFYHENEGQPHHTAISGIEQALWDIVGKALRPSIDCSAGVVERKSACTPISTAPPGTEPRKASRRTPGKPLTKGSRQSSAPRLTTFR